MFICLAAPHPNWGSSSQTRDPTQGPCLGGRSLSLWTTSRVPKVRSGGRNGALWHDSLWENTWAGSRLGRFEEQKGQCGWSLASEAESAGDMVSQAGGTHSSGQMRSWACFLRVVESLKSPEAREQTHLKSSSWLPRGDWLAPSPVPSRGGGAVSVCRIQLQAKGKPSLCKKATHEGPWSTQEADRHHF